MFQKASCLLFLSVLSLTILILLPQSVLAVRDSTGCYDPNPDDPNRYGYCLVRAGETSEGLNIGAQFGRARLIDNKSSMDIFVPLASGNEYDQWLLQIGYWPKIEAHPLIVDLTISSSEGGEVTNPGQGYAGTYDIGQYVNLKAVADSGYQFSHWTGDEGAIENITDINSAETTIRMWGSYSIKAQFQRFYTLNIESTDGGEVVEPGEGAFIYHEHGELVSLKAVPNEDIGGVFDGWTGQVGTVEDTSIAETTIRMEGDYNITARFLVPPAIDEFYVKYPDPKKDYMLGGQEAVLHWTTSNIDFCYLEGKWLDAQGNIKIKPEDTRSYTLTCWDIDYNQLIAEVTVQVRYELTVLSGPGGDVIEPGEGIFTYNFNSVVDLKAVISAGHYSFKGWAGDTGSVANPKSAETTIIMDGNYRITAEFEWIVYALTINSTAGGTVVRPGEGTFLHPAGNTVLLEAIPDIGYPFSHWSGDIAEINDAYSAVTTITMKGDYSITANFWKCGEPATYNDEKYNTVEIGGQCWFAENLRTDKYSDGTSIPAENYGIRQGEYFYKWAAVSSVRGLCPDVWRVPNENDWNNLGVIYNGLQLQTGPFQAKLVGYRSLDGNYYGQGQYAGFWSSEYYDVNTAWYRSVYKDDPDFYKLLFDKRGGFSVRCMQDIID